MASSNTFDGFTTRTITVSSKSVGKIDIFCRVGGSGPGLLLLHGHPQTSHIWRHVAGPLGHKFTVVAADLRGYGESSKPSGSETHVEYSKREMGDDMVQLMEQLGMDTFSIVAHDRGARVAHRLALDYPEKVDKMMLLDIAPTMWMYEHTNQAFAMGYWHWFFYPQPYPGPETIIGSDPSKFWGMLAGRRSHKNVVWTDEDVDEYQKYFFQPQTIHAICEDYRASAGIDLDHDREDIQSGRRLSVRKLRILWGGKGMIASYGDVVGIWKDHCALNVQVDGRALDCGHYVVEESPDEALREIQEFLA